MTEVKLLLLYGLFLYASALGAFIFIGPKAKTALLSGGMSGSVSLACAYFIHLQYGTVLYVALAVCLFLFVIFSWRSAKTLLSLIVLIQTADKDIAPKAYAFLIISLMAVVSLITAAGLTAFIRI